MFINYTVWYRLNTTDYEFEKIEEFIISQYKLKKTLIEVIRCNVKRKSSNRIETIFRINANNTNLHPLLKPNVGPIMELTTKDYIRHIANELGNFRYHSIILLVKTISM